MGVGVKAPPPGARWVKPPPPAWPGPGCNLEAYGHPRDLKGMEPGGEGGCPWQLGHPGGKWLLWQHPPPPSWEGNSPFPEAEGLGSMGTGGPGPVGDPLAQPLRLAWGGSAP